MSKKRDKKTDFLRGILAGLLFFMSLGFLFTSPLVTLLMVAAGLYLIVMDSVNESISKHLTTKNPPQPEYDPAAYGEQIKCPYCGKSIPSDIKFCFYCGKSLEAVQSIDALRLQSLKKIDKAAADLEDGSEKETVLKIRRLTDKILKQYSQKPDSIKDASKFTDYYLPKTVSAIEHYGTLCGLEDLDPDELKIKAQIEESLGMIEEAFSNILNRISTEGLDEASVDLDVLEAVMEREGLMDSDFQA